MIVLAIHNLKGNEALLARELAAVLGKTVFEAGSRVRAPGGGPSIIASFSSLPAAQDVAARLSAHGFDLLLLDTAEIAAAERRFVVRAFHLGADTLRVEARDAASLTLSYADVRVALRGVEWVHHQANRSPGTRKISLVRAALSGGLILTKEVPGKRPPPTEERLGFLELHARGLPPLVWRESELLYRSLAGALQPSRQANFAQVAAELRRRCPEAIWDARLTTRAGQAQLLGAGLSPEDHLEVAVTVLARALLQPPS